MEDNYELGMMYKLEINNNTLRSTCIVSEARQSLAEFLHLTHVKDCFARTARR